MQTVTLTLCSQKLWDLGIMGTHDPCALTRAVWWRNNFFGFRGRDEHRKLRWGDITIREEVDGTRYLIDNFKVYLQLLLFYKFKILTAKTSCTNTFPIFSLN